MTNFQINVVKIIAAAAAAVAVEMAVDIILRK